MPAEAAPVFSPLPDASARAEAERLLAPHGLSADAARTARWEPLAEGGSDRAFWRIHDRRGATWIVMRYSAVVRQENALYAGLARFLREIGVRVPTLLFHEPAAGLIGLEDLGATSLYRRFWERSAPPDALDALYRDALDQAARLHAHSSAAHPTMPGFDAALYRWERNYFLDNLVERHAGLRLGDARRRAIAAEGESLAARLDALPRRLIHRDFQSQNLFVRHDRIWMIDFQGLRPGHPAYDLASLLEDPYTDLDPTRRRALLETHLRRHDAEGALAEGYFPAAAQRLMQALGAYGYLGGALGKRAFLAHIPRALARLSDILSHLPALSATRELVHELRATTIA